LQDGGFGKVAGGFFRLGGVGGGDEDDREGWGLFEEFQNEVRAGGPLEGDVDDKKGDAVGVFAPDGEGSLGCGGIENVEAACL